MSLIQNILGFGRKTLNQPMQQPERQGFNTPQGQSTPIDYSLKNKPVSSFKKPVVPQKQSLIQRIMGTARETMENIIPKRTINIDNRVPMSTIMGGTVAIQQSPYFKSPEREEQSIQKLSVIEKGNIDLTNRPRIENLDGSISTVRSISINEDGKEILIPTIRSGLDKAMTNQEAIDWYHKTGEHLGKFNSVEEADKYAEQLHKEQSQEIQHKPSSLINNALRNKTQDDNETNTLERFKDTSSDVAIKRLLASMETSTEIKGDYGQLTSAVLNDLHRIGKYLDIKNIEEVVKKNIVKDPVLYDEISADYWDLISDYRVLNEIEKAVWWLAPTKLVEVDGKILDLAKGERKTSMLSRIVNLRKYFEEVNLPQHHRYWKYLNEIDPYYKQTNKG